MGKSIGFIGQGMIGASYADDFEERGLPVVRYDNERYKKNRKEIASCGIVFIAVPAPTTPQGFDSSILEEVLKLVADDGIAIIKSTMLPGTTYRLQKMYPKLRLMHSPEFLRGMRNPKEDARQPDRNILGYTDQSKEDTDEVFSIMSPAPYQKATPALTAELIKYMGNTYLVQKVLLANLMYDLSEKLGIDYNEVRDAVGADPRIGYNHLDIDDLGGRGAAGHCFIKDLAALSRFYNEMLPEDELGTSLLKAMEKKNIHLMRSTNKDIDLLEGVYGAINIGDDPHSVS